MNTLIEKEKAKDILSEQFHHAEVIFHPDTLNSFAAYQFILPDKYEIWMNARNGKIFHAGRLINRF